MADHQVQVHADQPEHERREQEDVGRVEAGEGGAADGLPGDQHLRQAYCR